MAAADGADPKGLGAEASLAILHRGDRYVVRFLKCNDAPTAIVCFEVWKAQPSLEGEVFAEGFLRNRGYNIIGILAAENDWFQRAEIEAALAAIRAATAGYDLIGYGGSMGAYACINFADWLGLRRVIAICPQYSIDQRRAPYEIRWRAEAARILANGGFSHDRVDQVRPPVNGWIIFDPTGEDRRHEADISRWHNLERVPLRFARHQEMRMLSQCGLLVPMLLGMLEGHFDAAGFQRRLRQARRRSAVFWISLSAELLERKHLAASLRAIRQARALPHPEPGAIDIQEAKVAAALGHTAEALALAARWTANPAWSWAAIPLVSQLQAVHAH